MERFAKPKVFIRFNTKDLFLAENTWLLKLAISTGEILETMTEGITRLIKITQTVLLTKETVADLDGDRLRESVDASL